MCFWCLFLISSASVRSIPFLSFIVTIFAWNVPLVSDFLNEISGLSHSVVFLYFFALINEEGFLISPCYSFKLCIQVDLSFIFSLAFHFSSILSYLLGLPRQPFCIFAFHFLGDDFDHRFLCSVTNLHPWFFRHSVRSNPLESICHFHCVIVRGFI